MSQFDPNKDARLQKYTTGGSTTQAVLTHESVGPDYIVMWLAARMLQASSGPHPNQGAVTVFSGMIASLQAMYPQDVPRAELVWSDSEQLQASEDGWGIFLLGAKHGIEIQKLDEANCFPDDGTARLHVTNRALKGSAFHQKALDYVRQERRRYNEKGGE